MDLIVYFFKDILDGPLYWIFVIICVLLILFLLGYILDRTNKNKLEEEKIANAPTPSGKIEFGSKSDMEVKKELDSADKVIDFTPTEEKMDSPKEQIIDFGSTSTVESLSPHVTVDSNGNQKEEIGIIDFSTPSKNETASVVEEISEKTMQLPKVESMENIPVNNSLNGQDSQEEIILTPGNK